jgi:hypothetical protein
MKRRPGQAEVQCCRYCGRDTKARCGICGLCRGVSLDAGRRITKRRIQYEQLPESRVKEEDDYGEESGPEVFEEDEL